MGGRRDDLQQPPDAAFSAHDGLAPIRGDGRKDVPLGLSRMASDVRYPDHCHSIRKTYLVLSEGGFGQGSGARFGPRLGGTFCNVPNSKHAMRSINAPLPAFCAPRA